MKVSSFFKILNRKINKYDKLASNPFLNPRNVIIVWVEDADEKDVKCYKPEDKL